ncbi:hypothetical protein C2E23DRAFT_720407 [Lenzites betulinus]|nr:hypothetical protein C2E23DRAFT_720407 [Lenzites betulinus]
MEDLRCVRYDNIADILEVTRRYDDGFMNRSTGSLCDYRRYATPQQASKPVHLIALYRGDALLLMLSHHALAGDWQLALSQDAEHLIIPALLDVATQKLAAALLECVTLNAIVTVHGHAVVVDALLQSWVALARTKGTYLRIGDPLLVTRSSYATRESIPPLSDTASNYLITPATINDLDALLPLHIDFLKSGPGPRDIAIESAALRGTLAQGLAWVCRVEGALAGYTICGRISSRTIAIRNVYVSPTYRRQGVAGAMVRALSRYHLGVRPVGYRGLPDETPATGVKDFVCINVFSRQTERIYRRAGFLFPDNGEDNPSYGGRDPVSGQTAWFSTLMRGVRPQPPP